MTATIIISFCVLVLIAYVFDLTFAKTRVPSVLLLLLLGWGVRQFVPYFDIKIPNFFPLLPVLGTVGLILIVLEGSLELELNASKVPVLKKAALGVVISMLASAFLIAGLFAWFDGSDFRKTLINAIPLCIISSAIAIPSVKNLSKANKEFIIYESSFSDIIGVIFFNFIAYNAVIGVHSFALFGLQLLVMIIVSFVGSLALSFLLSKTGQHIKFIPITLIIIIIYEVSKIYELPSLLFIMVFGLFIGNLDELKKYNWMQKIKPYQLNKEVQKFKGLIIEGAFLVRSVFFLLFGYLLQTSEIINREALPWTGIVLLVIFIFRALQLKLSKLPLKALLFVAPRGLITILLFLAILPQNSVNLVNRSVVVQVILSTSIIMMLSLLFAGKTRPEAEKVVEAEQDKMPEAAPVIVNEL